jgi:hypothetical protein
LYGSERIFLSVNGGPQLVSEGFDDSSGNIVFYTPTLPATNPTTVTTFDYYYSYESGLDIDYDSEEFNIFGDNVNINIETVGQKLINIKSFNDLNLESRNLFTLKHRSANNGIQIQTNASNSGPTWEFGADGTITFPGSQVVSTLYQDGGSFPTAPSIDLTKQVHKLADSDFVLPDGVEGQICYFAMSDVSASAEDIYVQVNHLRISQGGSANVRVNAVWQPFPFGAGNHVATLSTAIFTDGAWSVTAGTIA